ncbi:MAG: single-stranded DNA-binding protein [Bacteroides sp.]|uniref:single-stranded DNA-binding protein n=1 Tax=Bacteroides sp. TaxID=29523 RepID=UPI002FC97C65
MLTLQIIGNLGKDAEVKNLNGDNFLSFSVAYTEKYTDRNGNQVSNTTWVDCLKKDANGKLGQYLKKGTQVYVTGKPKANAYTSQSGEVKSSLQLNVRELELLGSRQEQQAPQQSYSQAPQQSYEQAVQQAQKQAQQQMWEAATPPANTPGYDLPF